MKHLLLALVLASSCIFAADKNPLLPIAKDMSDAAKLLEEERADLFVRAKMTLIQQKLDAMISKAEKDQQSQEQKDKKEEEKQQQQRRQQEAQRNVAKALQSLKDSQLSDGAKTESSEELSRVIMSTKGWANLPPRKREELIQTYGADLPERWRKRLEAYFVSIAAEEKEKK